MFINYRLSILAYLIIQTFLSFTAHAADNIKLRFRFMDTKEAEGTEKPQEYSSDIIKSIKTLKSMIDDLDGFKKGEVEETIPLIALKSWAFKNIIDTLSKAKQELKTEDLDQVEPAKLNEAVEKVIYKGARPSDMFFELMIAANYLDVPPIVSAAANQWLQQYSDNATGFNDLTHDVKAVIIGKLDPARFWALMRANEGDIKNDQQKINEEYSYKKALELHYKENTQLGLTAKQQYKRHGLTIKLGLEPSRLQVSGSNLFVASSKDRSITVINTENDEIIGQPIKLGNTIPRFLGRSGSKLLVASHSGQVIVIDTKSHRIDKEFKVPFADQVDSMAISGSIVLLAKSSGVVFATNFVSQEEMGLWKGVGRGLEAIAVSFSKLFVASYGDSTITVIDITESKKAIGQIKIKYPTALAVLGSTLFVANAGDETVTRINIESLEVIGEPIKIKGRPRTLAVSDSKLIVLTLKGEVWVINPMSGQAMGPALIAGQRPTDLALSKNKLYVANSGDSTITVFPLE